MHHLVLQVPASSRLDPALVASIADLSGARELQALVVTGAAPGERAVRLREVALDPQRIRSLLPPLAAQHQFDWALLPAAMRLRDFKLLALDMDSTVVDVETIDELGEAGGVKAQIAAITEAAMRGEITDFADSLRRRVALLADTPLEVLEQVWQRMRLNPGARELIDGARAAGLKVLLATGGFSWFTERLQRELGLDFVASNHLEMADGRLTGRVTGPIVDAAGKRAALLDACARIGCAPQQAIAGGDGANDVQMLGAAGLGLAYRAKPALRQAASLTIDHCGLDALLVALQD